MTPAVHMYLAVFCLNGTAVAHQPPLQVDSHYVPAGGAAVDELIVL